jgi:hypothetical protein
MNGNNAASERAVLDSNILIYRSNNRIDFPAVVAPYSEVYISVVAYMEVMGFNFETESDQQDLEKLLDTFTIIHTDLAIADHVIAYRKLRKVKLPDAITLATARRLNADLVTVNEQDFRGLDPTVRVVVPPLIET